MTGGSRYAHVRSVSVGSGISHCSSIAYDPYPKKSRAAGTAARKPAGALRAVRRDAVEPDRAVLHDAGRGAGAPARGQGVLSPRWRGDRLGEPDRAPHQDHQMVSCLLCFSTLCICYLVMLPASVHVETPQPVSLSLSEVVHWFLGQLVSSLWFQSRRDPDQDRNGLFDCLRYSADFGQDRDILRWLLNYLDPTKAGLLTHLLNDGGPINISYMNYDWSLNV